MLHSSPGFIALTIYDVIIQFCPSRCHFPPLTSLYSSIAHCPQTPSTCIFIFLLSLCTLKSNIKQYPQHAHKKNLTNIFQKLSDSLRSHCWYSFISESQPGFSLNLLKTKRRLLYIKPQSVPRCKHFSTRL